MAISLPNFERESFGRGARDDAYRLQNVQAQGTCTVHTQAQEKPPEYDPSTFDPMDPSTYPPAELYPDFDPYDPETWPVVTPSPEPSAEPTEPGGEPEEPDPTPSPPPSEEVAPPADAQ